MTDDKATIEALKELLATIHATRQGEHIRWRINELQAKGMSDADVLKALKANPPVLTPKF